MPTIKIRVKHLESGILIRILLSHPMETGRRQDKETGAIITAHYIQEVNIELNGKVALTCELGTAVSRDPYFSFRLKAAKVGDSVRVKWLDNLGQSDSEEILIQ